jgi:hypothetical protein
LKSCCGVFEKLLHLLLTSIYSFIYSSPQSTLRSTPHLNLLLNLLLTSSIPQSSPHLNLPFLHFQLQALHHFVEKVVNDNKDTNTNTNTDSAMFTPGQRILFIHTGGTLGMYEKVAEILPLLPRGQVTKLTNIPPPK